MNKAYAKMGFKYCIFKKKVKVDSSERSLDRQADRHRERGGRGDRQTDRDNELKPKTKIMLNSFLNTKGITITNVWPYSGQSHVPSSIMITEHT
jgi:hypothetical protein